MLFFFFVGLSVIAIIFSPFQMEGNASFRAFFFSWIFMACFIGNLEQRVRNWIFDMQRLEIIAELGLPGESLTPVGKVLTDVGWMDHY